MATTLAERSQSRENNLDFIRFMLAAGVCFTHSFNLLLGDNTDPLGVATRGAIGLGGTAVDMFFVISGFLVTKSWLNSRGLRDFLAKRSLRIYPAFLVVSILCAIVFGPLGTHDVQAYISSFDPWRFVRKALLLDLPAIPATLPGVAFPGLINGSLWTIKYEFACYLLLAAFGLMGLLRFRGIVLAMFLASLGVLLAQEYFHSRGLSFFIDQIGIPPMFGQARNWPRFLTYFLAGAVFHLYGDHIRHSRWLLAGALVLAPLLILGLRLTHLAMPLLGAYLVFYVAFSRTLNVRNFGKHGDFSYGVYLYAFPIQQLLAFHYGSYLTGLSMFFLSLAITTVFAVASWHLIEAPSLRLKGRLRARGTSSDFPAASTVTSNGASRQG